MSESLAEALSGAAGGAFSSFCVYPIEVVKTVMQVVDEDDEENGKHRKAKTVTQVCNDIVREQGYFGFFKGVELGSLQSALQNFVRFYISKQSKPKD